MAADQGDSSLGRGGTSPPRPRPSYTFLLHTFHATGHVLPMQAVAQALVARGHRVVWLTSLAQEPRVLASGASFIATDAVARADAALKAAAPKTIEACAETLFGGGRLLAQVADLRRALSTCSPDCLLNDALPQGAAALHELLGAPFLFATLGVVPMYLPGEAVSSKLGTLMTNHALVLPVVNTQREELGLPPLRDDPGHYSPHLHLQASCASLEYHHDARMPQTRYVGPLVSAPVGDRPLPPWWDDVLHTSRRVVGVTQGTFATDPTALLIPAISALQDDDDPSLLLVVPTFSEAEIRARIPSLAEDRVRFAEWVPYDLLLPRCAALVTNGGYGSVTQALAAGVPLVCAGASEDKRETAARVARVGAGIDLGTDRPDGESVREAVRTVLEDKGYRERAAGVGEELNALGGAVKACEILEEAIARWRGGSKEGDGYVSVEK